MTEPLAIVLITTSFPISGNGSEAAGSFVSDLVEELGKHVKVRVVAPGTSAGREVWCHGVEVFRYPAPDKPLSTLKPWRPDDLLALRTVMQEGRDMTRAAVAAGPTAHVLALWALPSGHWAREVWRESGVPYSVWTLGSDIWSLGRIPMVRGWLRRVLKDAQHCYSDGLKLAEDTRRIAGREVSFLPSTRRIDRSRKALLKSEPPYRLLFLGRWHPNKGIDLLLQALALLGEEDWRRIESLRICGGGPMDLLVKQGVAGLQALGRPVELAGYLDKSAAEEVIVAADYLLIPSRIESIPVVFSDAIKLGCPVLVSPVGDLPQLVGDSPQCGLIAAAVDAESWSRLLSRALTRRPAEFAAGVADRAGRFDLAKLASSIARQHGAKQRG